MNPENFKKGGRGEGVTFLRANANYQGDDCLIWPFSRHPTGYGSFSLYRTMYYAHRYMCELVNGPAPTPQHQAAHLCGRGHEGCVNPRHLQWKTVQENLADRRKHGTVRSNTNGRDGKLSEAQIECIRALKGVVPQLKIAEAFGVKRPAIQYWHRHERPKAGPGTSRQARRRQALKAAMKSPDAQV